MEKLKWVKLPTNNGYVNTLTGMQIIDQNKEVGPKKYVLLDKEGFDIVGQYLTLNQSKMAANDNL